MKMYRTYFEHTSNISDMHASYCGTLWVTYNNFYNVKLYCTWIIMYENMFVKLILKVKADVFHYIAILSMAHKAISNLGLLWTINVKNLMVHL